MTMFDNRTGALINSDEVSKNERNHDKEIFYNEMRARGFDFTDVEENTRLPKSIIPALDGDIESFIKFNNAIIDIHRKKLVSITDSIIYLVEDWLEAKDVIKLLQTITLNYLQNDLRIKYKINKNEIVNKFKDFIY